MTDTDRTLSDVLDGLHLAMVATADDTGTWRARPLSLAGQDGDALSFLVSVEADWVAALDGLGSPTTVTFAEPAKNTYVAVQGTARVLDDRARIAELWNPGAGAYFDGQDDPQVRLLEVTVQSGEYWDGPRGRVGRCCSSLPRRSARRPASRATSSSEAGPSPGSQHPQRHPRLPQPAHEHLAHGRRRGEHPGAVGQPVPVQDQGEGALAHHPAPSPRSRGPRGRHLGLDPPAGPVRGVQPDREVPRLAGPLVRPGPTAAAPGPAADASGGSAIPSRQHPGAGRSPAAAGAPSTRPGIRPTPVAEPPPVRPAAQRVAAPHDAAVDRTHHERREPAPRVGVPGRASGRRRSPGASTVRSGSRSRSGLKAYGSPTSRRAPRSDAHQVHLAAHRVDVPPLMPPYAPVTTSRVGELAEPVRGGGPRQQQHPQVRRDRSRTRRRGPAGPRCAAPSRGWRRCWPA